MNEPSPWETTEFNESKIAYIIVNCGSIIDAYIVDIGAYDNLSEQGGDSTRRLYVESIEPVRVAGQHSWVVWFEIYLDGLKETINPVFVSKVGYS